MKTRLISFLLLLTLVGGASAAELPEATQAILLDKKIVRAIEAGDDARTKALFVERAQLQFKMPPALMIERARFHYRLGEYLAAHKHLIEYLATADPASPLYDSVLDMLITLEERPELIETLAEAKAEAKVDARFAEAVGRPPSPTAKDANGWTDLHYAAVLDLSSLAKRLLQSGATVDARLKSDSEPFTDELKATLRRFGEDYDSWTRNGETPLHIAAYSNAVAIATLLVERGAAVNAKSKYGTPLHLAAYSNAVATATLLVERGAAVNVKSDNGATPLHLAAYSNAVETATLLIERGAAVNAKDDEGYTPLHSAANNNAIETATLLVERGAAVNAKDKYGDTPLADALGRSADEVAAFLRRHGGKK